MAAAQDEPTALEFATSEPAGPAQADNNGPERDPSVEAEDGQYHDTSNVFSVPTKDEEAVAESKLHEERPGTAGTTRSGTTDFNEDDRAFLESIEAPTGRFEHGERKPPTPSPTSMFLERPDVVEEANAPPNFSFAMASKKPLDLRGSRKPSAASLAPLAEDMVVDERPSIDENGSAESQRPPTDQQAPDDFANSIQHPGAGAGATESTSQQAADAKPRKKRKKKKRYDTAATEPLEHYTRAPVETLSTEPQADAAETGQSHNEDRVSVVDAFQPTPGYPGPTTPGVQYNDSKNYEATSSSPHDRLQDDLHAVASEHDQIHEGVDIRVHDYDQHEQQQELVNRTLPTQIASAKNYHPPQTSIHGSSGPQARSGPASHVRALGRPDTKRVTKRKSKVSWRAKAPVPAENVYSDQSTSDINDYMQILAYKVHEKNQSSASRHAAEHDALRAELHHLNDAKQALSDELATTQQQKAGLAASLSQQQGKIAVYEAKVNRFRTFVDGLGKDMDALKKDAGATRRSGEQLAQKNEDRKAEQAALFQQLASCAEKSSQLKDQALKACLDAQSELQAAHFRNDYLERQLSERSGLLAEERDRRSQLERQLITAASPDDQVLRLLTANNEATLDKLYEIHATVDEVSNNKKEVEMLEKTVAAIQELTAQNSSNADEIVSVKGMVESLGESVAGFLERAGEQTIDESVIASVQTAVDEALKSLKSDLSQRELQIQQEATSREQINSLQGKLEASTIETTDLQNQLCALRYKEKELDVSNKSLQTKIEVLQSNFAPGENAHVQLSELKGELNAKSRALETANTDLGIKMVELQKLEASNAHLQERVQVLQHDVDELQPQADAAKSQRLQLEQEFKSRLESERKSLCADRDESVAHAQMKLDNTLHSLTTNNNEMEKKLGILASELATTKEQLAKEQSISAAIKAQKEDDLKEINKQLGAYQQKAENLQQHVNSLESSSQCRRLIKEQFDDVMAQLNAEQAKLSKAVEDKNNLDAQVQSLQTALQTAQAGEQQATSQLAAHQQERHAALEEAERLLARAQADLAEAHEGLEAVKEECNESIEEEKAKSQRHLEALQKRLSEAEKEVQTEKSNAEDFQAKVDEAWRIEQNEQKMATEAMNEKIKQAERQRAEAEAEAERLRKDVELLLRRQMGVPQAVVPQQPPGGAGFAGHVVQPTERDDVTPTPSNKENEPPRPRKKVDHNANVAIEADPISAPEVPRPHSRANSAESRACGPVVEESHLRDVAQQANASSSAAGFKPPSKPVVAGIFSDSDDMLDTAFLAKSQHLAEVVEEPQIENKLPSFAAFNIGMTSSQPVRPKAPSSICSVPSIAGATSTSSKALRATDKSGNQPVALSNPASFTIFDDNQPSQGSLSTHEVLSTRHKPQDVLKRTETKEDKYTYRKPMPQPNSASKMLRQEDEGRMDHRQRERDTRTPAPPIRGEGRSSAGSQGPPLMRGVMHSSSPDFINDGAHSGRKMNTYHTPGGASGSKRRDSRTNTCPTADPRLKKREAVHPPPAAKRKSGGQIVEGYEHERKRRKAAESAAASNSNSSRYALRGSGPPSIHDLPTMSGVGGIRDTIPRSVSGGTSRMRTLAGNSTRGRTGMKKVSKTDRFNARFNQELYH